MEDISQWNKYIQQYVNLDDPFHYNWQAIEFYQQRINRVYNKKYCLIPTDIYATLFKEGLLVYHFLCISIKYRFLSPFEKAQSIKSYDDVSLSIKYGGSTNHLIVYPTVHQAHIPILLSTLFLIPKTLNIIYIKGITQFKYSAKPL
jgi:hypothetical protein